MKKLLSISLALFFVQLCNAQFDTIHSFNNTAGMGPRYGALAYASGMFYGMTLQGGANNDGCVFSIHADGSGYKDIFDFNGTNGLNPWGGLTIAGNKLYGMTLNGGANNYGNLFCLDTNGGGFRNLWNFDIAFDTNGRYPYGDLTLAGDKLYGMTGSGGLNAHGNIFRIDTNGGGYHDIWDFQYGSATNGESPFGSLTLIGGKLYGMTNAGGLNANGNIFRIDTSGTGYKDLWNFNYALDSNGSNPYGSLTLSGGVFYGITSIGGKNDKGNIFRIDTSGTHYKDLWDFANIGVDTNGSKSYGNLVLAKGELFGMACQGALNGYGNIFKIDTDGTGYKDLVDFNENNIPYGGHPYGTLTLVGNTLYGMASDGGLFNDGIIFSFIPPMKITTIDTGVTCNGVGNGKATALVNWGTRPYTYLWSNGGTDSTAKGLSAGTYKVLVHDADNYKDSAVVIVTQPAALHITAYSTMATVRCEGEAWVTVTGGTPAYKYSWAPGGQTSDTIFLQCVGNYTCTVTDKNGCMLTATDSVFLTTGIAGISNITNTINIYPDPNIGHFTIAGIRPGQVIELYNFMGQQLMSTKFNATSMQVDISDKANGIYFLRILNADGSLAEERKIVKQQ